MKSLKSLLMRNDGNASRLNRIIKTTLVTLQKRIASVFIFLLYKTGAGSARLINQPPVTYH